MHYRKRRQPSLSHRSALIESLENRVFLSVSAIASFAKIPTRREERALIRSLKQNESNVLAAPVAEVNHAVAPANSPGSSSLTPAEVASAYGVNSIQFGSVAGTGAGQTIAIIDAYDDPNAASDLHQFDLQFGLPDAPSFQRLNQKGVAGSYPATDPAKGSGSTWEIEESLDIEWAHAMAPQANIDLIEANSPTTNYLIQIAANTARNLPGVVAVSMSFSAPEAFNDFQYDAYFTTPAGHTGVTFLAATGDTGQPSGYPAYSPNVVAVGGTTLHLSGSTYQSETAWSGSGGGISKYEPQPAFQQGIVTQSSTSRTVPDVSMEADPGTGVAVYDSFDFPSSPWIQVGGTSLATPMWAGLIAIADQGRSLASLPSLDGATQTLPALYQLPATDFHDITSGSNGFSAGPGYDLVTGRGSPIANLLVPALVGTESISGAVFQDNNGDGVFDSGDLPLAGQTVYLDTNNNGVLDAGEPSTVTGANGNYLFSNVPIGSYVVRQVVPVGEVQLQPGPGVTPAGGIAVAGTAGTIAGENFADFPDVFSTTADSQSFDLTLDPTGTDVQIFNSATSATTPAYQAPLADLPSLTFNLPGATENLTVDYTNGNPIPAGGLTVNGNGVDGTLTVIGQNPSQELAMSATQIGTIAYQNVENFSFTDVKVDYTGDFSNLPNLDLGPGTDFVLG
jgi:subtilase family serine protease